MAFARASSGQGSFRAPLLVVGAMLAAAGLMLAAACLVGCSGSVKPGEKLVVVSFTPDKRTDDAFVPILLKFNRPVVRAGEVGKPLGQVPVEVFPAVKVAAHWLNRETLVVKPLGRLADSTRYRVLLKGDLSERASQTEFAFVHNPVEVKGMTGVQAERLPPKPTFALRFNQSVWAGEAATRCSLSAAGKTVKLSTPDVKAVASSVALYPDEALQQDTEYKLVCRDLVGAGGNAPLEQPYELALKTYPGMKVASFKPQGEDVSADEVPLEVSFATPVSLDEVRKNVTLKPAAKGFLSGSMDYDGTRYWTTINLAVSTRYELRVKKELRDQFGQALAKDEVFRFKTGNASPQLSLEKGIYAVEAKEAGYPIWSRNVRSFRIDCAVVPRERLAKLLTSEMDYDPWYTSSDGKQGVDWSKLGLRHKVMPVKVNEAKNKWQLHNVRLNEVCGGGKAHHGLYLAEVSSPEVEAGLKKGLEGDEYFSYRYPFRVLANLTDLGVLVKAGTASGLVWVAGISDGKPVQGARVTIYTPRGKVVHQGTTDANGIASLPGTTKLLGAASAPADPEDFESFRSQRLIAVVEKAGDMAVVDGNWCNGIQIWNFGVPSDRDTGLTRIRGFIQSDRGIYRPGEKVHFKGIVREIEVGKSPRVPAKREVAVEVKDARDATIFRKKLELTPFGGFFFDLKLSKEASLGDYTVLATVAKQNFRERFQVEEFRKVTYELELKGTKRHEALGQTYGLSLGARYLFGAPVVSARVQWNVQRRAHQLHFPAFSSYAFNDFAAEGKYFWYYEGSEDSYPTFVSDGEGETDGAGLFRFGFKDPNKKIEEPQDYIVHSTVTDQTDQSVGKSTVFTAHKVGFYVGLHAQEFVQAVDMPFAVNAVAVAPDGTQVPTKATLSFIREQETCAYGDGYRSYPECKKRHETVLTREISIPATGTGTERIVPKQPGEFIVRVEAQDAAGHKVAASSYIWVIGKGEAFWSGDESARMSLVSSKTEYKPGEIARLVPRASLPGATALVTLERNGILEARVMKLQTSGEGITIPIGEQHAPNVFASVALITGRTGQGDRHRPQFKLGVTDLKVSAEGQRLKIALETDQSVYEPGKPVSGKIRVTSGDKPVRAELSLSVADEGVLQLIAYKTPDPMRTFFAAWGLGVDSATNWNRIARLNDPQSIEGEGGGADGAEAGPSRVRSKFVNSAYWAAALVTDENGEVPFSFTAPDNLTAFRLMAVAADEGSRFGSGESRITIRKPLLANPVLPRFLSAGDAVSVGVTVHNYTNTAGTVVVKASAKGVQVGKAAQEVRMQPEAVQRVDFPIVVGFVEKARFRFEVSMGPHSDAFELSLPVTRPMVKEKKTVAQGEVEGEKGVPLEWPGAIVAAESRLEVSVDRTGLAELGDSLRYLIEYPYGCLEQTLSRFIPLTKVEDLAASLDLKGLRGARLKGFIRAGAAKVVRHQHASGHFSLWPSSDAYPHLTAYALYGLDEARSAGIDVDEGAVAKGAHALKAWANASERTLGPGGETATVAMAAYVLARLKQPDTGLNARLFEVRKALPRYGKAFLLRALKLSGAPAAQVKTLSGELLAGVVSTDEGATLADDDADRYFYMSSSVRTTALALSALLEVEPQHPLIPRFVEGLKRARRPNGAWTNTQDNLYSLVALADYARQRSRGATDVKVLLGGKALAQAKLVGGKVLALSRPLSQLKPGELKLVTKGRALYTVRLALSRRDEMDKSVERGLTVEREYSYFDSGLPVGAIKAGQLIRVKVKVTSPARRHYLALVDPLPGGFEAINQKLATSENVETRPRDEARRHWYPGHTPSGWVHQELRDDRVEAFADWMPGGSLVLEYVVRATIPGKFTAAPARAEAMYEPEINGRTALTRVEVTKQ